MATTTNYGWTTPDDTGLVKDGASAIRTLGTSADTTVKNLNPETTLGDIAYRSSTSNVNTRLGIGSTGQVLTVASGVPSWATLSAGGKTLLSTTSLAGTSTTISNIDQSYKDLLIVVRGAISSQISTVQGLRLNGDTGANYTYEGYPGVGGMGANEIYYGLTTTSGDYNKVHNGEISIMRYTETENKLITFISHQNAGSNRTQVGTGRWDNTSAITSITICTGAGTYSAGTIYLYGVK